MSRRGEGANLLGMNADIVIFFALQLAAVLGIMLLVATVLVLGDGADPGR